MALPYLRTLAGLAPRVSSPSGWTAPIDPVRARSGSRSAIPPASRCSGSGARFGIGDPRTFGDSSQISGGYNFARVGYATTAGERLSDGFATARRETVDSVVGSRN